MNYPKSLHEVTTRRIRAEEKVGAELENITSYSTEDVYRLVHDLQVHHAELEMQNEELRSAQQELAASNERYYDLYDRAPVGYITADEESRIIEINAVGAQLFGQQKGAITQRRLTDFIATESQDDFYLCQSNLGAAPYQRGAFEAKLLRGDHSSFWAQATIERTRGENQQTLYRVVVIDISKSKDDQERLLESEEQFQQIVEALPIAVFFHTANEIVFSNAEAVALVSLSERDEFKGRSLLDFIHPGDEAAFTKQLSDVLLKKAQTGSIAVRILSGGTVIDVELLFSYFTFRGEPTVQITAYNMTSRKKLEAELFKAEKLESISVLAGGIAHDFNNYLTVLLGNLSLALSHKEEPHKLHEYLERMKQATLQTRDLTSQLFAFTKNKELVKHVTSIESLVVESATFALSGSNVRCDFSFPDHIPLVEVDKGQIAQVIYNIIINAVQAMPDGGNIRIRVEETTCEDEPTVAGPLAPPPGDYVKVSVTDEGPGIPEEIVNKVFDPFFTTKDHGSGLGLASCYSIIRNHNGTIHVASQVGEGATVSFSLPTSTQSAADPHQESGATYGMGRILVMDDEKAIRDVIGQMLTTVGYEVQYAANGVEAIAMYQEELAKGCTFDLVIMDLTIRGGMGGKSAIKELLKIDPDLKAIVASGYSKDPVISDYRRYGFKGVIRKPFSIVEVSKVVSDVL